MTGVLLGNGGQRVLAGYGWAVVIFMILPAAILVPISFSARTAFVFPPDEWSLRWYAQLVDQPRWRNAAVISLAVAAASAALAAILGTLAAIGLSRLRTRAGGLLKLVFVAPIIVPLMVLGVGFYVLFARLGVLGGYASLVLAHTALGIPFVVTTVAARLVAVDPALERAAAAAGAGPVRTLLQVTLPLLVPSIAAGTAFAFIFSFDEVVVAQFLTGPTLETLPRRMWEGIAVSGLENTITAVSTIQLAVALAVIVALELWRRRSRPVLAAAADGPAPGRPAAAVAAAGSVRTAGRPGVGIVVDRLQKRYRGLAAVEDVSIDIAPGEFVTLLGPSGSGKTTLLMLVAGFIGADGGRLLVNGRDVSAVPPHRRNLGIVFQSYALFPHMSVGANVAFPLQARGVPAAVARRQVAEVLELVQLGGFAGRRIQELSGGQQQRVALARAIVFDPGALLMDEPLAALDRNLRAGMQVEIRRLQRALGQTVLYVTHDQEEAMNLSDRIGVMRDGRLQQIDTPQALYARPANTFVAEFFGEANLLRCVAGDGRLRMADGRPLGPLPGLAPDGPATLCVRPEVVRLDQPDGAPVPAIPGRVAEARFQGSLVRITVECAAGTMVVTRAIAAPDSVPPVGAPVRLGWDPGMTHVMEGH